MKTRNSFLHHYHYHHDGQQKQHCYSSNNHKRNFNSRECRYTALKYRALDQEDMMMMTQLEETEPMTNNNNKNENHRDVTNSIMRQVLTRTPPGFNIQNTISTTDDTTTVTTSASTATTIPSTTTTFPTNSAINKPLIKALLLNQGLILGLATFVTGISLFITDGWNVDYDSILHWTSHSLPTTTSISFPPLFFAGVLSAIPIVGLGNAVEDSDDRTFTTINFSTIIMVMTLFGRHTIPPKLFQSSPSPSSRSSSTTMNTNVKTSTNLDVLMQSIILASVTGICEELVFRLEVPSLIHHYSSSNIGDSGSSIVLLFPLLGQAFLFALGHAQRNSTVKENMIVMGLQFINGLWFGLIYILNGGTSIVPCIVAHAIYDFVVFFKTWNDANTQLEYAERMVLQEPMSSDLRNHPITALLKQMQNPNQILLSSLTPNEATQRQVLAIQRLFYLFDFDQNQTLSKSEVRKGFSYLALERGAGSPPLQETVDALFDGYATATVPTTTTPNDVQRHAHNNNKKRLTLADFVQLYMDNVLVKNRTG